LKPLSGKKERRKNVIGNEWKGRGLLFGLDSNKGIVKIDERKE